MGKFTSLLWGFLGYSYKEIQSSSESSNRFLDGSGRLEVVGVVCSVSQKVVGALVKLCVIVIDDIGLLMFTTMNAKGQLTDSGKLMYCKMCKIEKQSACVC